MAKGEWIPHDLEKEMAAFIRGQPAHFKRRQILVKLQDYLIKNLKQAPGYPAKATLLNMISEIRNWPDPEAIPWSIGLKTDIPQDTLPAVLHAWKQCYLEGQSFTKREAKWCARLSTIINDTRTLLSFARGYANREIIYGAIGKSMDFDTSNLDKVLTMEPWELATACLTREIRPLGPSIPKFEINPQKLSIFDAAVPYEPMTIFAPLRTMEIASDILERQANDAQMSFILLTPMCSKDIFSMILIPMPEGFSREQFIDMRVSMRKTLSEQQFSHEQMRVYTLWLEYLAAGLHAQTLEERQVRNRIKIVNELRRWIKNHPLAKDSSVLLPFSPEGLFVGASQESQKISAYVLEPLELLEKVGIKSFLEVRRRR